MVPLRGAVEAAQWQKRSGIADGLTFPVLGAYEDVSCISQVMQDTAQNSPKSILSDKACITKDIFGVDPVPLNSFSAMPSDFEICSYSAVKNTLAGKP